MKSRARPPRRTQTQMDASAPHAPAAEDIARGRMRERGFDPGTSNSTAIEVACLLAGSPREVLARIVPGDPLGVRDAVVAALHEACVFLDADRVHLRGLARIARGAARSVTRADLAAWVREEVAAAVAELLREEIEAPRADPGTAQAQFARPLGLDPEAVQRGCAAFNRLPRTDRAAFFALVLRDVGLDALARATGEAPSELGRRARRGLDAVLHAHHPELPPPTRPIAPARDHAVRVAKKEAGRSAGGADDSRQRTETPR
ncbi:MAG: hypothetical protein NTY35_09740 [Planctomycetota bacterium]|nr:hypothetical protein [Planctomycetota bacterium]